jgi:hypothetical protein
MLSNYVLSENNSSFQADLTTDYSFSYLDTTDTNRAINKFSSTNSHFNTDNSTQKYLLQTNSTLKTLNIDNDNYLADKYSDKLLSYIKEYGFESGFESPADNLLLEYYNKYGDRQTINILATLWRKSYHTNGTNYITAVLNLISNITFHIKIDAILFVFASSALNHAELEVKESALALFESWDEPDNLPYIKGMDDTGVEWFDEYKSEVINTLEAKK